MRTALAPGFTATCVSVVFLLAATAAPLQAAAPPPRAYAVAEIHVTNPAVYKRYLAAVTPIVKEFGGRYLVRAGAIVPLEGNPPDGRFVVIEFPDLATARRFEASPEYRAIAPLRQKSARSRLFLVEGVSGD